MADAITVTVSWETLETRHSVWCGRCLLPSASAIVGALLIDGALQQMTTYQGCPDCGTLTVKGNA